MRCIPRISRSGRGRRLAIEDAIALARAINAPIRSDAKAALAAYQAQRKPILDKLVTAANASAAWYENFGTHMALAALRLRDVVSLAHRADGYRAHPQGGAEVRRGMGAAPHVTSREAGDRRIRAIGWGSGQRDPFPSPPPFRGREFVAPRNDNVYCGFSPMPPAIMLRMICEVPATMVAMRESR